MAGNSRDAGRAVTARALSVLTAFDAGHTRQTLTEIARRADIPLATAHRLVGELERWGALQRDRSGHYAVGLKLWELGRLAPVHTDLYRAALPVMRDLSETTGESVHLVVRDGFEAVSVERLSGRRPTAVDTHTDERQPLHATAAGKVLLAYAPASLVDGYCERGSSVDVARFRQELCGIRERGHALAGDAVTAGDCSVAVPVRDGSGTTVAALGLVAHSVRAAGDGDPDVRSSGPSVAGRDGPPTLVRPLLPAADAIGRGLADGWGTGPRGGGGAD